MGKTVYHKNRGFTTKIPRLICRFSENFVVNRPFFGCFCQFSVPKTDLPQKFSNASRYSPCGYWNLLIRASYLRWFSSFIIYKIKKYCIVARAWFAGASARIRVYARQSFFANYENPQIVYAQRLERSACEFLVPPGGRLPPSVIAKMFLNFCGNVVPLVINDLRCGNFCGNLW